MADMTYAADLASWSTTVLDDIRNSAPTGRGRKMALRATASEESIKTAARFVAATNIHEHTTEWALEDKLRENTRLIAEGQQPRRAGGRPPSLSHYTFWVATMACTFSGLPASYTQAHHLLTGPLSRESRRLLGLAVEKDHAKDAALDERRRNTHYSAFTRLATRVTATFEPRPFPSRTAITVAEAAAIDAARDPEVVALKQRRADRLSSHLLLATFHLLPTELQRRFNGDITLDGTVVATWGKFGHHSRRRKNALVRDEFGKPVLDSRGAVTAQPTRSPEALAGWHAKDPDSRDTASNPFFKPQTSSGKDTASGNKKYTHGFDAHLALIDSDDLPQLILGASLDTPGCVPGLNAAEALRGISSAGLKTGILTVDNGYSQVMAENFALPIRALGYDILRDFKRNELGKVLESYEGIQCIEGRLYGPCLPEVLKNASLDFAEGRIDDDTYRGRLDSRKAYEVRLKRNPDGSSAATYRCPGTGPSATVNCPLKSHQRAVKHAAKSSEAWNNGGPPPKSESIRPTLPLIVLAPSTPPKVCSNKESITVPKERFARYVSVYGFQTPEYRTKYTSGRNRMEGKNRVLKDTLAAAIADPDQRRFRGWAKQVTALVTKLVAANMQAIVAFVEGQDRSPDDASLTPHVRHTGKPTTGRPKHAGLDQYLPAAHHSFRRAGPRELTPPKSPPADDPAA